MGWREERRKERHTVFPSWSSISVTLCKTESEINWVWEKIWKRKGSKQRGDEGRGSGAADVHTSVISKAWLMDMLLLTWAECLLYFCYCDECSFSMPLTRSSSQGHGVVLSNDKYSWIIDWPYPWNSLDTARESLLQWKRFFLDLPSLCLSVQCPRETDQVTGAIKKHHMNPLQREQNRVH